MAATDVAPIAQRLHDLIAALPDIGLVHLFDLWDRDDVQPLITSEIHGVLTTRAWWISGPQLLEPSYMTQSNPANALLRPWLWRIGGIEGLDAGDNGAMQTMRSNMVAVLDAVDVDRTMGGTAHRVNPARIVEAPQLRLIADRWACAYVEIEKVVFTLSTP